MKTFRALTKQCGFFDLGLTFIILALAGTVVVVKKSGQEDTVVSDTQTESIEMVTNKE